MCNTIKIWDPEWIIHLAATFSFSTDVMVSKNELMICLMTMPCAIKRLIFRSSLPSSRNGNTWSQRVALQCQKRWKERKGSPTPFTYGTAAPAGGVAKDSLLEEEAQASKNSWLGKSSINGEFSSTPCLISGPVYIGDSRLQHFFLKFGARGPLTFWGILNPKRGIRFIETPRPIEIFIKAQRNHFCTQNRCVSLQNWGTQTDGLSFISAHISIRLSTAIWPYVPGQWFQSSHVRHIISREKATQLGKPTLEQTKTWVDYLWQNNSVIK